MAENFFNRRATISLSSRTVLRGVSYNKINVPENYPVDRGLPLSRQFPVPVCQSPCMFFYMTNQAHKFDQSQSSLQFIIMFYFRFKYIFCDLSNEFNFSCCDSVFVFVQILL
jgi:hypothetical protein